MNNTITVDQTPSALNEVGIPRMALTGAFILLGLILLYFASRHIRRHHKTSHHRRY